MAEKIYASLTLQKGGTYMITPEMSKIFNEIKESCDKLINGITENLQGEYYSQMDVHKKVLHKAEIIKNILEKL